MEILFDDRAGTVTVGNAAFEYAATADGGIELLGVLLAPPTHAARGLAVARALSASAPEAAVCAGVRSACAAEPGDDPAVDAVALWLAGADLDAPPFAEALALLLRAGSDVAGAVRLPAREFDALVGAVGGAGQDEGWETIRFDAAAGPDPADVRERLAARLLRRGAGPVDGSGTAAPRAVHDDGAVTRPRPAGPGGEVARVSRPGVGRATSHPESRPAAASDVAEPAPGGGPATADRDTAAAHARATGVAAAVGGAAATTSPGATTSPAAMRRATAISDTGAAATASAAAMGGVAAPATAAAASRAAVLAGAGASAASDLTAPAGPVPAGAGDVAPMLHPPAASRDPVRARSAALAWPRTVIGFGEARRTPATALALDRETSAAVTPPSVGAGRMSDVAAAVGAALEEEADLRGLPR